MNDIVRDLLDAAQKEAHLKANGSKLAYARGVRDMAAIISACANVAAELMAREKVGTPSHTMLKGYSDGLRHIADCADDLIPPGYEP